MQKQWRINPANQSIVNRLHEELKIPKLLCHLLAQRGIENYDTAKQFFRPEISHLHDPWLMQDMTKAVDRLERAITNKEKILLYGDYDVDGTTSVAMLYSFLEKYHQSVDYYIPDRYKEGYGISDAGIDYAQQNGVKLIIAMDCGIKAHAQVRQANERAIDCIICDHHLPDDSIPEATAVLDPKRKDCVYPYKELSGCGITFKLIQAYAQRQQIPFEEIESLLDLLVISIACDIVPMDGENRVFSYLGLQILNQQKRLGLQALIEQSGRTNQLLDINDLVFGIGPMINAAGRLGDAKDAVRLLLSKELSVAQSRATHLDEQNKKRRAFDKTIATEAKTQFTEQLDWQDKKSIVLYNEHWHKGVIGIAASRMVEAFNKPAILLTESGGQAVGSARSVPGFDIHTALQSCEDLLSNFGGHMHAAGLTIPIENLPAFQKRFEQAVADNINQAQQKAVINIAAELELRDITMSFANVLKQFAPFGPKNRKPVFLTRSVMDTADSKIVKEDHLRLAVKQEASDIFYGIAFGMADQFDAISNNQFDICYTIQENNWKGRTTLQLNIKDIKV